MSRLYNHYYFLEEGDSYEARKIAEQNAAWEQWEMEQANALTDEPPQTFTFEDGSIIEEKRPLERPIQ